VRLIPVLDLQQGLVVRGIAGRRHEYRPLVSPLAADSRPVTVGRAFQRLGLDLAYVADLDALAGATPAWDTYRNLAACGLRLWIDAGVRTPADATVWTRFAEECPAVEGIIAGLESLPDPQALAECRAVAGSRLVFSLDLRDGQPWTSTAGWSGWTAAAIGRHAIKSGVERVIVLDVGRVGTGQGVGTEELLAELHAESPQVALVGGGGVRGPADLASLAQAGCWGALVASALHDGRIQVPHGKG